MTERNDIRPLRRVLVANRGEIASRVMRSCKALGIETVAVFSDADEHMPFVREADVAVRIGPAPSVESYLRVDRVIEAARRTGADAIHPGYGFLSENPELPRACEQAGLTFVGPRSEAIRIMGSKKEAKARVAEAGVPVVPGYDGAQQDTATLAAEARRIGLPVLIKASAGGGGKGMRVVREDRELSSALDAARRESTSAFGDGTLILEKYLESPRHVEVQILGDRHGRLVHLFERECSIQRRHQKIIEEAPSPALDPALRSKMGEAAVEVGRSVDYVGAGTVEFLLAPDGSFYFLEMNTRLQVEHPVTELITGVDLVREQLRVAEGHSLAFTQDTLSFDGAAVECRLYAEDPATGFLPQSGRIVDWHLPGLEGLRVDGGVETGTHVDIHYDPMLAKLVAWGPDRPAALRRMRRALEQLSVQGIRTNRAFLARLLEHPEFVAGRIDTHFIETHMQQALADTPAPEAVGRAAIAATLAGHEHRRAHNHILPGVRTGWRNNPLQWQWAEYEGPNATHLVRYENRGGGVFAFSVDEQQSEVRLLDLKPDGHSAAELRFEMDGVRRTVRVVSDGDRWHTHGSGTSVTLVERPRFPDPSAVDVEGACVAPMPGKVLGVRVQPGDRVEPGQVLVVLEAMKMEHSVTAGAPGTVHAVHVDEGEQVDADALLVVLEQDE
jgi:acetyl-CoA carboxylase biotin carboxylase subunit